MDRIDPLKATHLTILELASEIESFSRTCGTFVFLNYFHPFAFMFSLFPLAESPSFFLTITCFASATYFSISFLVGVVAAGRLPIAYLHFSHPLHLILAAALPLPLIVFAGLGGLQVPGLFGGILFGYALMVLAQYGRFAIYHSRDANQISEVDRRWLLSHSDIGSQGGPYKDFFLKSLSGGVEFALFVAIFVLPIVLLSSILEEGVEGRGLGKGLGYLAFLFGTFAVFVFVQFRSSGLKVSQQGSRKFHLYLRSFERSFDRISQKFSRRSDFSFLKKLSAGEFLSKFLTAPIIAAHNTNRFFKEVGPSENSYSHEEWRHRISADIDACTRIFVCLSVSPSLKEELNLIREARRIESSMFIFSPKLSVEQNLAVLRKAKIMSVEVGTSNLDRSVGVFFSEASGWVIVQSGEDNLSDVGLMFLCAAFLKKDTPRFKGIVEKYGKVLP